MLIGISPTGSFELTRLSLTSSYQQRGFTLLETVLVVTIIGILIGLTTISLSALDQRHYQNEAHRLKLSLNQALDFVLMKKETLAWFYDGETRSYQFRRWHHKKDWAKIDTVELFKLYELPQDYYLEIEQAESLPDNEEETPQVVFFSSGEYTPFQATLKTKKHRPISLFGDGFSAIAIPDNK